MGEQPCEGLEGAGGWETSLEMKWRYFSGVQVYPKFPTGKRLLKLSKVYKHLLFKKLSY